MGAEVGAGTPTGLALAVIGGSVARPRDLAVFGAGALLRLGADVVYVALVADLRGRSCVPAWGLELEGDEG